MNFWPWARGWLKSRAKRVSILTDMAIAADKIDESQDRRSASARRSPVSERSSLPKKSASVNASLARSLAQLHVKRRRKVWTRERKRSAPQREP